MRYLFLALLLTSCARQMPEQIIYTEKAVPGALICLDPGHGGHDPGTQSPKHDYQEKKFALATALLVRNHLQRMGYQVMMTRDSDRFLPLEERARLANEATCRCFISIHYNAAATSDAKGIEVFCFKKTNKQKKETRSKQLADAVLAGMIHHTKAPSRGVKAANFSVLRNTKMPAILVEGGFLTNADELQKVRDPRYANSISWGIAQGIHNYLATISKATSK